MSKETEFQENRNEKLQSFKKKYLEFLKLKIKVAEKYGFEYDRNLLPEMLFEHQKDIIIWALSGGRRAIFASFGLGKTMMQLVIGDIISAVQNKIKHVCPLQLDIIERLIERYSMEGETVLDPFGGIMSVPYVAVKMKRKAIGIELNQNYWKDGIFNVKSEEDKDFQMTLF